MYLQQEASGILSRGPIEPDAYLKIITPVLVVEKWPCRRARTQTAGLVTGQETPEHVQAGVEVAWALGSAMEIERGGWVGAMS